MPSNIDPEILKQLGGTSMPQLINGNWYQPTYDNGGGSGDNYLTGYMSYDGSGGQDARVPTGSAISYYGGDGTYQSGGFTHDSSSIGGFAQYVASQPATQFLGAVVGGAALSGLGAGAGAIGEAGGSGAFLGEGAASGVAGWDGALAGSAAGEVGAGAGAYGAVNGSDLMSDQFVANGGYGAGGFGGGTGTLASAIGNGTLGGGSLSTAQNVYKGGSMLNNLLNGGGSGGQPGTGGSGGNLAGVVGGAYDAYAQNKAATDMLNYLKQRQSINDNMYAEGSPELSRMRQEMERKDAAAGRNSQYGTREVDLASKIAQIKSDQNTRMTMGIGNMMANAYSKQASAPAGLNAAIQKYMQGQNGPTIPGGGSVPSGGNIPSGYNYNSGAGDYGQTPSYSDNGGWQSVTDNGGDWGVDPNSINYGDASDYSSWSGLFN